jgi:TusA-related sulfurtransferase
MSRVAKPVGPEVDLRVSGDAPGVQLVRALTSVEVGETVSIVAPDARATVEVVEIIRATGNTLIASIPFDGYVRLVVRRRK